MNKSYDDIVQELVDLDVKYLNLHRAWRKEKSERIRIEQALKQIIELVKYNDEELGLDCEEILDKQSWT